MLNKQGSTLIESLLAFEIFISVLVLFLSLTTSVFSQEVKLQKNYQLLQEKEVSLSKEDTFTTIVERVLH